MILKKYSAILDRNKTIMFLFLIIIMNYAFFNYRILFRENGYILGDWVVNYSGGFIKRGFLGHIFFSVAKNFDISIKYIVFIFSSIIHIISIYFFFIIIKNRLSNNLVFIFVLLPSTFLFNFFDPLTIGRKEVLIFFFFSFYFVNLKKIYNKFIYKLSFFFLFLIIILTHELIFFFIPYLFLLKFLDTNQEYSKINYKNYHLETAIFILGIFIMILFWKFSHLHNNKILCNSLLDVNLTTNTCWAINDFKDKFHSNIIPYLKSKNYFINYSIYFFLSVLPLTLLVLQSKNRAKKIKFLFYSCLCLFFSFLFYLHVNDWGRYLNVTFLIQFLVTLKFIENDFVIDNIKINLSKIINLIFIFFYLTTWHMPHCCNPNLGLGYKDIYYRIKFRLYDTSTETTKYQDLPRKFLRKLLRIN